MDDDRSHESDDTSEKATDETEARVEEQLSLWQTLRLLYHASRGYWAVNLVNFGDGIAYFGVLNLLALYLEHDVGMATAWAHFSVSTFTGIVTVGTFLGGGFMSDWLGVRRALTLSLVLTLIGRVILVLAPGLGGAAAVISAAAMALLVMGLGEAVIQPALYAGVKEYADSRTATMGYAIIYAVMNLGIVAEQAVSPLIRDYSRSLEGTEGNPAGGISGVLWFLVIVTALYLVVHLALFTRRVEQTQRIVEDEDEEEKSAETSKGLLDRLKALPVLDRRFLFFIFVLLPVRTLFAHQWLTIPDYVMRCFPASVGERYEWITGLNPLIVFIGVPLIAAWTRKVNIITMMIIGTSISAMSTMLLMTEPNVTLLITYVIIFSIGEAAWSSRFLEYVAELAPAGKVGAYMGVATLPWFLAKWTTGMYSGWVLEVFLPESGAHDPVTMWMIYGAISVISPIGLLIGRNWVQGGVRK